MRGSQQFEAQNKWAGEQSDQGSSMADKTLTKERWTSLLMRCVQNPLTKCGGCYDAWDKKAFVPYD